MSEHPVVVATRRLHSIVTAAVGDEVSVDLGPVPGETQALDSIAIGLSVDDVAAISGATEYEGLAMQHDAFDINCMVQSMDGGGDALGRLARCFELLEVVGQAVLNDQHDAITWGRISRHQVQWVEDERSRTFGALLVFPVAVEAYRVSTTG